MAKKIKYHADPDDVGTKEQRKKRVNGKYKDLMKSEADLRTQSQQCIDTFKQKVACLVPPLPSSASESEVETAIKSLIKKHAQLVVQMKPQREEIKRKWDELEERAGVIQATYLHMKFSLNIGHIGSSNLRMLESGVRDSDLIKRVLGSGDEIVLQQQIHSMGQVDRFSKHMKQPKQTRPEVVLGTHARRGASVPLEIMTMVYSHCELEESVTLRQVNTDWYSGFQCLDLESKVKDRFPWMVLEDDMDTWGLCALVFVARLKKWMEVHELNKMYHARKSVPLKQILAVELEQHKLPGDFEPVQDEIQLEKGSLNVTTMEFTKTPPQVQEQYQVEQTPTGQTVTCKSGLTLTIPSSAALNNRGDDVVVHSAYIVVKCIEHVFVFPRNKPLHYSNAIQYTQDYRESFALRDIYVKTKGADYEGRTRYEFGDFHARKMRALPPTVSEPVAIHNGIIWWLYKGKLLIPMFVDLKNPDKMYCRKDRVICLPEDYRGGSFTQVSKIGYTRFVTRKCSQGMLVVDLDAKTATHLVGSGTIVCGFVKGDFSARYLSHKTISEYQYPNSSRFALLFPLRR